MRRRYVPLVALLFLALVPLLLQSAVPAAYAWNGNEHHSQNQVNIDSVTCDGNTCVVEVSATINNQGFSSYYGQVMFMLRVSYGSHPLDPRNDGTQYFMQLKTADLTKQSDGQWRAEATFTVPLKGYYYYLFELDAWGGWSWIGSDWVDPIEGTAPD